MRTCQKCHTKFPIHQVVDGKKRNLNNRKYCLTCSPFNLHNTRQLIPKPKIIKLSSNQEIILTEENRYCFSCKKVLPAILFPTYNDKTKTTGKRIASYCKKCCSNFLTQRRILQKTRCVNFLGGKCMICGYNRCQGALEFHHRDPAQKDFSVSESRIYHLNQIMLEELQKCVLLCSVCHREVHAGFWKIEQDLDQDVVITSTELNPDKDVIITIPIIGSRFVFDAKSDFLADKGIQSNPRLDFFRVALDQLS